MPITIPAAPLLWVRWDCRRCGHKSGVARTTVPIVDESCPEETMRTLLDSLRRKLVGVHMRGQQCIATPEDFIIYRGVPDTKTLKGSL